MERKTITIEEIEANPKLDLTERINKFANEKRWSADDLRELAIASIKQEYEYMANNMADTPHIDEILEQILNGHVFTQNELIELMTSDIKEKEEVKKYKDLKKKVLDSNGITLEDFNELCQTIGFDSKTTELIRAGFESRGKIINSYEETNNVTTNNHKITEDFFYKLCEAASFDSKTVELIKAEFESKGLLIDSHEEKESHHK